MTKTVYDYALFYEDGHREGFYLEYGPESAKGEDTMITDVRNNPYMQRFAAECGEINGLTVWDMLDDFNRQHSFAFLLVNPPREIDENDL